MLQANLRIGVPALFLCASRSIAAQSACYVVAAPFLFLHEKRLPNGNLENYKI